MLCPRFLTLPRDDSDCCPMSHGGYFAESSFFVFCSPYKEVLKSLEPHVIELYFERLNSGDVTACGVWENNPVIAACGHFYDLTSQVHSIPRSIEWDLWIKADIVSNRDFTDLEKMCIVANGFVAHGNAETGVYEQKIGDAFHRVCKLPASKFGGVSVRQWLLAYSRALAMLACIEDPEFESQSALDDRLNHEQSMHRADNFFYSFPVEARNVRQSIITSSNRIHRAWRAILVANGRMSEECKTLPFVPPLFLDVKSTRLSPGFLSDILVPTLNKWGFHITSILSFDLKQLPHYPPCQTSSDSTNKNKEEEEEEECSFNSSDEFNHEDDECGEDGFVEISSHSEELQLMKLLSESDKDSALTKAIALHLSRMRALRNEFINDDGDDEDNLGENTQFSNLMNNAFLVLKAGEDRKSENDENEDDDSFHSMHDQNGEDGDPHTDECEKYSDSVCVSDVEDDRLTETRNISVLSKNAVEVSDCSRAISSVTSPHEQSIKNLQIDPSHDSNSTSHCLSTNEALMNQLGIPNENSTDSLAVAASLVNVYGNTSNVSTVDSSVFFMEKTKMLQEFKKKLTISGASTQPTEVGDLATSFNAARFTN
eukprot:GDKK01013265.1.p1 GENE.GDKK01013265.1~~GDKK01013265.1.p1  ORF type:complete len:599 (+),score=115.15 GDKK01013265.1:98-1894(+)